jgi:hypothetical protein
MHSLGTVISSTFQSSFSESQIQTVFLTNSRISLDDGRSFMLPDARLEHYTYKTEMSKKAKFSGKQHVLSQVTLWNPSTLPPNSAFVITAINEKPFRLAATTDDKGLLTARTPEEAPLAPAPASTEAVATQPALNIGPTLQISEYVPEKPKPKPELRWNMYPTKDGRNGGTHGYLRLKLEDEADAIKILVLTRGCAQGFSYNTKGNGIIWAKTITGQSATCKLLQKAGYVDSRQLF